MGKKLTPDEYRSNVHIITKGEIKVLDNYVNQNTGILHEHSVEGCGHKWYPRPKHILHSKSGCPKCKGGVKRTSQDFLAKVNDITNSSFIIESKYKGDDEFITIKHLDCNNAFDIKAGEFLKKPTCKICNPFTHRPNKITNEYKVNEINYWINKIGFGEVFKIMKAWRVSTGNLWTWHIKIQNIKYGTFANKSIPSFKIGIEQYGEEYLAKSNPSMVTEEEKKLEIMNLVVKMGLNQYIYIENVEKVKTPKGTPYWKVHFTNKKYNISDSVMEYSFKKNLLSLKEEYIPISNMGNKTFEKKENELSQYAKRYEVDNVFEFKVIEKIKKNGRVSDWRIQIKNLKYNKSKILGILAIKKGISTHREHYLSSDNFAKHFTLLGSRLEFIIHNMLKELNKNYIHRKMISVEDKIIIPDFYLEEDSQVSFIDSKLTYDTAISLAKRAKGGYSTTQQRYEPHCHKLIIFYLIGDLVSVEMSEKTTMLHVDYLLSRLSLEKQKHYKKQLDKIEKDYYKIDLAETTLRFSSQEVEDIFKMYIKEKNMTPISLKYNVPIASINRILRRKSYKFIDIDEMLIKKSNDILDGIDKLKFLPLVEEVFKDYVEIKSSRMVAELPKYNTNSSVISDIINREIYSYVKIDEQLEKQAKEILRYNKGSLTERQVILVFKCVVKGMSTRKIAKKLGVSRGMVSNIINRKSYLKVEVTSTLIKQAQALLYERDASKEERQKRFNEEEVLDIINKFVNEPHSVTEIANIYKRNRSTIYDVINRESYKNVKLSDDLERSLRNKLNLKRD
ncbi:hypothetical protein ACFVSS_24805 [Peribacillus butanolivorans]|uniref:hypothetical protein n=1 Tax=Peribacillus butanolivorans TaxID=421767 RepID=UPI0036D8D878